MNSYGRKPSNTLPLAIIGAVCMAIVAAVGIVWMKMCYDVIPASIGEDSYETADIVSDLAWGTAFLFETIGAVLAGLNLLIGRAYALMTTGAVVSIIGDLYVAVELLRNAASVGTINLLHAVAWAGILMISLRRSRRISTGLKILVMGAPSAAFVGGLIRQIIMYYRTGDFWYLTEWFWIAGLGQLLALAVGLIMIVLVLSARAGAAGRTACGQTGGYGRPPVYGQADMYGQSGGYGQADMYDKTVGYGQAGMYGRGQGYGQPPFDSGGEIYGPGYGQATEILPPEMNGQAPEYGRMRMGPQGEMRNRPRPGRPSDRRQEAGWDSEAFCGNCGAKVRPGTDFCTRCGAPLR